MFCLKSWGTLQSCPPEMAVMDAVSLLQGPSYLFPLTSISRKKPSEAGSAHECSELPHRLRDTKESAMTYRDPPPGSGASTPPHTQAGTQTQRWLGQATIVPETVIPSQICSLPDIKSLRGKNHFTFWVRGYQSERVAQKNASASSVISSVDRPAPGMS